MKYRWFIIISCAILIFSCARKRENRRGVMTSSGINTERAQPKRIIEEQPINEEIRETESECNPIVSKTNIEIPISSKNSNQLILKRIAYMASYNKTTRTPNWIAWHLTSRHAFGHVANRKNYDFHEDPDVPEPRACKNDWSYNNNSYQRGHMCPAADNKWSNDAMNQCFLMTNICPQNGKLNEYAWRYLEEDCRNWASKYGDIYIVCGPIYKSTQYKTLGRNHIAIPDAFFKVILRLGKDPQALGFIYPNRACSKPTQAYMMSVDAVEKITGFDFFSSIDNGIENQVESRAVFSKW